MEALKKLECLSLVSKVCTELEAHIGCGDKTLAKFIIYLPQNNEEFGKVLKAHDAEMQEYFVKILLTIIHAILPPVSRDKLSKGLGGDNNKDLKRSAFLGLAVPDSKQRVLECGIYRGRVSRIMDKDCFVQLLGVRDRKEGLVHVHNIASPCGKCEGGCGAGPRSVSESAVCK